MGIPDLPATVDSLGRGLPLHGRRSGGDSSKRFSRDPFGCFEIKMGQLLEVFASQGLLRRRLSDGKLTRS